MLYPFGGQDFSLLGYNDLIVIMSELGEAYFNQDPKIAYDVFQHRVKIREAQKKGNDG